MQDILKNFSELTEAVIDASSIIYMHKAGYLELLSRKIQLFSLPEIMIETSIPNRKIELIENRIPGKTNDDNLLDLAIRKQLPIISEDKKLLLKAGRADLQFYNSLMMLCFLLYKDKITKLDYKKYHKELTTIARYNQYVWDFGEKVFKIITKVD